MTVPTSNLCILGLAREKKFENFGSSSSITGAISLVDLFNGTQNCGPSGAKTRKSNTGQTYTNYPKPTYVNNTVSGTQLNCNFTSAPYPAGKNLSFAQFCNYQQERMGNWSTEANLPTCRALMGGFGQQTTGAVAMGTRMINCQIECGCNYCSNTYEWNGSSWSTGGSTLAGGNTPVTGGTSNNGVVARFVCSGTAIVNSIIGYKYNGTTWCAGKFNNGLVTNFCGKANTSSGFIQTGLGGWGFFGAGGLGGNCRKVMGHTSSHTGTIALCLQPNLLVSPRERATVSASNQYDFNVVGGYRLGSAISCFEVSNGSSSSTKTAMSNTRVHHQTGVGFGAFYGMCVWGGNSSGTNQTKRCNGEDWSGTAWTSQTNMTTGLSSGVGIGVGTNQFSFFYDCALHVGGTAGTNNYAVNTVLSFCAYSQRYRCIP